MYKKACKINVKPKNRNHIINPITFVYTNKYKINHFWIYLCHTHTFIWTIRVYYRLAIVIWMTCKKYFLIEFWVFHSRKQITRTTTTQTKINYIHLFDTHCHLFCLHCNWQSLRILKRGENPKPVSLKADCLKNL